MAQPGIPGIIPIAVLSPMTRALHTASLERGEATDESGASRSGQTPKDSGGAKTRGGVSKAPFFTISF